VEYVTTWFEAGETHEVVHDSARKAFHAAKGLIDTGKRRVEITMPATNSVIRGAAILDIYDAVEQRDAE
jgi:hypothetical protein